MWDSRGLIAVIQLAPRSDSGCQLVTADLEMVIDVVDDGNRPIGIARRAEVFERKLNFRTVHVFLFDSFGRVLLQKLPNSHLRNPGRLGSSVAGYLYSGESYATAAYRKMQQELNIETRIQQLAVWQMIDEGTNKFVGLFRGTAQKTPEFDRREIDGIVAMDPDTIEDAIRRKENLFTPTFVFVYERFRTATRRGR